ncbi:MAG: hypothetical protein HY000_18025 [Planctomycetes bacterium]|nr:hypothetical protein [Planctomycetota bacterium]
MDHSDKLQQIEQLRNQLERLESELREEPPTPWRATSYYTAYYANNGFMLGMFAAISSLLFNVVGATLVGKHPLELIRVYLTFPLGEEALSLESGLTLAIGCCLYIATGMLLGIPMYLALTRWTGQATFFRRLLVASGLMLGVWIVNYYCVLSWLQPLLFGGNWIIQEIPWWVGALTHLVYGWTMVLLYPLGLYHPYLPYFTQSERP